MNRSIPAISVVIPLYNKEKEISQTLQSVVEQTRAPLEVLIVDDGSTDNSQRIAKAYIEKHKLSEIVRVIEKPNGGVSSARNKGILESKGDFVTFIDADDRWEVHFLQEISDLIRQFPEARAYATNYQKVDSNGNYINPKVRFGHPIKAPELMECYFKVASKGDLPILSSAVCVERTLLEEIGMFPEGEPMGEDQDLWSKIALSTYIAYSPRVLSFYHLDSGNRACHRHFPDKECGFSQRLKAACDQKRIPSYRTKNVLAYTATHLIHLARLNLLTKQWAVTEELLSDPRCNLLFLKKWHCYLKLQILKFQHILTLKFFDGKTG